MDGYILDLRNKFQHMQPKKPQLSPHKHHPIDYGATQQLVQPTDTSQPLNEKGNKENSRNCGNFYFMWEGQSITNF